MVFSGIVETKGTIVSVIPRGPGGREDGITLTVEPLDPVFLKSDIALGCSIAVNGTCLTVTQFDKKTFRVDLAPETLRKTSFGDILAGSLVNLETAMRNSDRNSGHTVQGHIDGTGKIVEIRSDGVSQSVKISICEMSEDEATRLYFSSLIVPKGFIAVDGASLTICEVNKKEHLFTLMLIPHTQEVLKPWCVGDMVNIELDCLAKYVSATVSSLQNVSHLETRMRRIELTCIFGIIGILVLWIRK